MSPRSPLLLVVLFLAPALAGCVDSEEPEGEGPVVSVGPPEARGVIQGTVADAVTLEAVQGVSMVMAETLAEARTDAAGFYAFRNVPAGRYLVAAIHPDYEQVIRAVDLEANRTVWLNLTVEPLPDFEPFVDSFAIEGFYECTFGTPVLIDSCTFPIRTVIQVVEQETGQNLSDQDDFNNARDFFWDTQPFVTAIVQELVWTKVATSTTDRMRLYLARPPIDPLLDSAPSFMETDGVSPIRQLLANVTKPEVELYKEAGFDAVSTKEPVNQTMLTRVYLPFDTEPAVAMQQRFTVHVSVFYGMVPDPSYTAIPAE